MNVQTVNHVLALGALISIACLGLFILSLFLYPREKNRAIRFLSYYGLEIGFATALLGVLLSLYYSDIIGYEPCKLCWFQRIFLYPQVVILGLALWKKEASARLYSLALAGIGALIAVYHIFVEHNLAPTPCGATGPSCAVRYVYEYGFVSIPVMSLTAFLIIIISLYWYKSSSR
jgi:hypothetical protein